MRTSLSEITLTPSHDTAPQPSSYSSSELSIENPTQDFHLAGKGQTGLRWMNGLVLLFYGYTFWTFVFNSKNSGPKTAWSPLALSIFVPVAACVLGFLAARNPKSPTRRLAKWSNLAVVAQAFLVLCYFSSNREITVGAVLGVVFALPVLFNIRAFWKRPSAAEPTRDSHIPQLPRYVEVNKPDAHPASEITPTSSTDVVSRPQSSITAPPANREDEENSSESWNQKPSGQATESLNTVLTEPDEQSANAAVWADTRRNDEASKIVANPIQAPALVKRTNYFVRHWRGELSLGISYWVNGLLATFLVAFAATALAAIQDIPLKLGATLALLVYAAGSLASAWQLVGIWRSALNHVSRGGKSAWATVAKVLVILGLLRCLGLLFGTYIPQSVEMVSVITGDTQFPAYHIRVLPGGTEIEFRGGLRAGCAKELERVLTAVPQAKVLHIESPGGRIAEASKMIQLVRERGLITYTSESCMSAATLVLMSGKERVVAAGAKVGFHAGSLPGATVEQQREMDDLVRTTMHSAGASEQFIKRVLATPSSHMWYPTFEEMLSAGVVTSQSFGDRFATSWDAPDAQVNALIQKLGDYPGLSAIRDLEPEVWTKMTADFVSAIRSGKSEAEATAAASQGAAGLMQKYFPTASDQALLAMRDQWIALLSKYKDKNSRGCIAVFTGGKISFSRVFPDWDETSTLRVLEMVMRSGAATRTPIAVDERAELEDLKTVFNPLMRQYGDDLLLLQKEDQWMDNAPRVSAMLLAMYQQIAALPDKRSANLVRYLVTSSLTSSTPPASATRASEPDRRPNVAIKLSSGASVSDDEQEREIPVTAFTVSSITVSQGARIAVVNGTTMQEGFKFGLVMDAQTYPMTLKRIENSRVIIISRNDREMVIPLHRK